MNTCTFWPLSERLRVFISSAQAEENGFAWGDFRRRIKDRLSQCACLNPFIIEDEASHIPSTQLYQLMVARSDLYILLAKGEIRRGTSNEYALAVKLHKPMLAYFLHEDKLGQSVKDLRNDIISNDRCTFFAVSDFSKIEETIWEHIMKNLVVEFQYRNTSTLFNSHGTDLTVNDNLTTQINIGFASKVEISRFQSCYNYFFKMLNLEFFMNEKEEAESEWHHLGCSLIKWIVTGEWELSDKEIRKIIIAETKLFSDKTWLQKRWNAIKASRSGDMKKAFSQEKQALKRAREAKEPDWIVNNILIDCRNMEIEINHQQRKKTYVEKYQNELNSTKAMICLPIADRYLTNIYKNIEKDEFRVKTALPYTELYGSNLSNVLTDLANYMFTAVLYGSETHLQLSRKILSVIFDRYSVILNNDQMKYDVLRQFILMGDAKSYKLYIDTYWDNIYSIVASKSDELWKLTDCTPVSNRDVIKLSVFSKLGLYFTDNIFKEAEKYIYDYSCLVSWDTSDRYFEAILGAVQRLNADKLIQAITPIIADKRYSMGDKFSHIILYIDLKKVTIKTLKPLAAALKEQLPNIICNNGDPQMIAVLVNRSKDLFVELEHLEGNGLNGLQKALYYINLGSENWETVLNEEINIARAQFDKNKQGRVFFEFMYDPYSMINTIIRRHNNNAAIDMLLMNEFIPLAIDILNSAASVQTKEPCIACLCEVFGYFIEKGIELPRKLKDALKNVNVRKGEDFLSSNGRKSLEIRLMMAQILVGIQNVDGFLQWCIDFGSFDIKNKIVVIDCLEKFYYHNRDYAEKMDLLSLSIALQCFAEEYSEIRRLAIKCLAYANHHEIASVALNKAVYDPSANVRITLLRLCKMGIIPKKKSENIIKSLRNDANYTIRTSARRIANKNTMTP